MSEAVTDFLLKQYGLMPIELVSSECAIHLHFFFCLRSPQLGDGLFFSDEDADPPSYLHPVVEYEFCKN